MKPTADDWENQWLQREATNLTKQFMDRLHNSNTYIKV